MRFDIMKPNSINQKLLDEKRINSQKWSQETVLKKGLINTINFLLQSKQ